jgi:hypothetical protein
MEFILIQMLQIKVHFNWNNQNTGFSGLFKFSFPATQMYNVDRKMIVTYNIAFSQISILTQGFKINYTQSHTLLQTFLYD